MPCTGVWNSLHRFRWLPTILRANNPKPNRFVLVCLPTADRGEFAISSLRTNVLFYYRNINIKIIRNEWIWRMLHHNIFILKHRRHVRLFESFDGKNRLLEIRIPIVILSRKKMSMSIVLSNAQFKHFKGVFCSIILHIYIIFIIL